MLADLSCDYFNARLKKRSMGFENALVYSNQWLQQDYFQDIFIQLFKKLKWGIYTINESLLRIKNHNTFSLALNYRRVASKRLYRIFL